MTNKNNQLELDANPTPAGEAGDFQSADENALEAAHKREMATKSSEQGPIGRWIGSSDSSLNVCFVLLVLGFIAMLVSGIAMIWSESASTVFERLITFELTIAGYVMGKNHRTNPLDQPHPTPYQTPSAQPQIRLGFCCCGQKRCA